MKKIMMKEMDYNLRNKEKKIISSDLSCSSLIAYRICFYCVTRNNKMAWR